MAVAAGLIEVGGQWEAAQSCEFVAESFFRLLVFHSLTRRKMTTSCPLTFKRHLDVQYN